MLVPASLAEDTALACWAPRRNMAQVTVSTVSPASSRGWCGRRGDAKAASAATLSDGGRFLCVTLLKCWASLVLLLLFNVIEAPNVAKRLYEQNFRSCLMPPLAAEQVDP